MAVVINEFEAIAGAEPPSDATAGAGAAAPRIEAVLLRAPLHRLARRHQRVKAH